MFPLEMQILMVARSLLNSSVCSHYKTLLTQPKTFVVVKDVSIATSTVLKATARRRQMYRCISGGPMPGSVASSTKLLGAWRTRRYKVPRGYCAVFAPIR